MFTSIYVYVGFVYLGQSPMRIAERKQVSKLLSFQLSLHWINT